MEGGRWEGDEVRRPGGRMGVAATGCWAASGALAEDPAILQLSGRGTGAVRESGSAPRPCVLEEVSGREGLLCGLLVVTPKQAHGRHGLRKDGPTSTAAFLKVFIFLVACEVVL